MYFSLRHREVDFNEVVQNLLRFFRNQKGQSFSFFVFAVLFLPFCASCNLFHPTKIAQGSFFVVERELVGDFEGSRLIFNGYHSLVASAEVRRSCRLATTTGDRVVCSDNIQYIATDAPVASGAETVKFAILFHYDNDLLVQLDYSQDAVNPNQLRIFRGGSTRGAAIQVYGDSLIPGSNVRATMDMTLVRWPDAELYDNQSGNQSLPRRYYERRDYSYFGLPLGYEMTFWHRSNRSNLPDQAVEAGR